MLAVANVVSNRVVPGWAYVPWNLAVAVVVVVMARRALGRHAAVPRRALDREIGLGEWRRGAVFGGALALATIVVMLIGLAVPAFRALYEDRRVDESIGAALVQALVRVPLGTVLLEEIAFRGVLPAVAARRIGVLRASVVASVAFGLWHVLPAWNLSDTNQGIADVVGSGALGTAATVTFGVAGTALAGLWWCWIRYRSRSVLATVIAHTAANSVGYLLAYAVTH